MRSLHRGTVYYRVEENTSPSTVSETFMISIFAWVKIPYSKAQPLQQHFRHCTSKNCGRQRSRVSSRCSLISPWFFSRIQVYASVYINGNLYSQHHIKQCKKKSETAAARTFQCMQNRCNKPTVSEAPKLQQYQQNIPGTKSSTNPFPTSCRNSWSSGSSKAPYMTKTPLCPVPCQSREVWGWDQTKYESHSVQSTILLYILYIHMFATTYAKIHTTCSLLDTSLNLISKSKWRKNLLSGKKMWLCVCWSHSPPTCRRVKSRPRKHLHSCMGGHVGVSTLDIKSGESI